MYLIAAKKHLNTKGEFNLSYWCGIDKGFGAKHLAIKYNNKEEADKELALTIKSRIQYSWAYFDKEVIHNQSS